MSRFLFILLLIPSMASAQERRFLAADDRVTCRAISACIRDAINPSCGENQARACSPDDETPTLKHCVYESGSGNRISRHTTREAALARAREECDWLSVATCPVATPACTQAPRYTFGCAANSEGLSPAEATAVDACVSAQGSKAQSFNRAVDGRSVEALLGTRGKVKLADPGIAP